MLGNGADATESTFIVGDGIHVADSRDSFYSSLQNLAGELKDLRKTGKQGISM